MPNSNTSHTQEIIKQRTPAVRFLWRLTATFILLFAVLGTFNFAMGLIDNEPPITYKSRKALNPVVHRGGVLEIQFEVERHRYCRSEVSRWLLDSQLNKHAIPSYSIGMITNLGYTKDTRQIEIPKAVALGKAQYYTEISAYCNFFQSLFNWPIKYTSPYIEVEILPEETLGEQLLKSLFPQEPIRLASDMEADR